MDLSEKLRTLRNEKGMLQKEVAEAIGVTVRSIKNYEAGDKIPKRDILVKLAELYDVELSELINEEDDFILKAYEANGSRGKAAAEKLLRNTNALFAGGRLSEEDKDELFQAIQETYWECKLKNKKYTPKKYRKENSGNDDENK